MILIIVINKNDWLLWAWCNSSNYDTNISWLWWRRLIIKSFHCHHSSSLTLFTNINQVVKNSRSKNNIYIKYVIFYIFEIILLINFYEFPYDILWTLSISWNIRMFVSDKILCGCHNFLYLTLWYYNQQRCGFFNP